MEHQEKELGVWGRTATLVLPHRGSCFRHEGRDWPL